MDIQMTLMLLLFIPDVAQARLLVRYSVGILPDKGGGG